jgi:MraZ protein
MTEATAQVDLNGEFRFKTDAKGRMSLPSKFRKVLSSELVVTRDLEDECILVFETQAFNQWVVDLFEDRFEGGYKSTNRKHRDLRRKLKARALDVQVDAAGRIMLPADQREAVGIDRDVVIVGNTGYFEVWDAKRYDDMDGEVDLSEFLIS